ncbi:ABC transporter permease, partial [Bacillus sp. MHSD17]|nr:ABC transporter permease [Bacillus sp. MHSD17]
MRVDWSIFWPRIVDATGDTLLMVIVTLIFATILGIPLGLLLYEVGGQAVLGRQV